MDPDPGKTIILFSLSLERASCLDRTIPELDKNLRVGFENILRYLAIVID